MKQTLKQKIFQKRKSLAKDEVKEKSKKIIDNLKSLKEFQSAKNIMFYVSFNNEVDTIGIIKELLNNKGKKIIVPFVQKNNPILQLSEIKDFDELEPKKFGILESKDEFVRKFDIGKVEMVIVPGLVFDKNGHRIGYGYGYYDRFLRKLKGDIEKVGLAFEFQLVDKIPEEKHDVPMDIVVTEKEVIMHGK